MPCILPVQPEPGVSLKRGGFYSLASSFLSKEPFDDVSKARNGLFNEPNGKKLENNPV
jgi:hypothetical protein